ncbi:MAG: glycoside hydrolase family 2 TIM barrel-domain containing protein [Rikenellaceae bacterium]
MKRTGKFKLLCLALATLITTGSIAAERNINLGWRFTLNDEGGAKEVKYDDSKWRSLDLPHDWAFENGYSIDGAQTANGGYASGGIGWYRRELNFTKAELEGKNIFIDFGAVYMNSEVWINGEYLGKRPYGYISFSYELTPYLKEGSNTLSVRVDNSLEPSARWYHGCGIYGDVDLRIKEMSYFERDGITITTPTIEEAKGSVNVTSEVVLRGKKGKYNVSFQITDASGKAVIKGIKKKYSLVEGENLVSFDAEVANPALWSPETPNLYFLELSLEDAKGNLLDTQKRHFGFRTIDWDIEKGMFLNGEQYKLRGVCEHMEGGPTGAFATKKLLRWKLQNLKDMGCNAIRVAHNPYLPAFYEVCDEIGLLVMDEIFDGWKKKAAFDYGMQAFDEWWERDLRDWIRRDKNHPSIFLYSLGNETHGDIATELVRVCHEEDPTRLVTSGDCNPLDMDVYGVNGRSEQRKFLETFDTTEIGKPFIATENPHTWQVRGYYRTQTWYRDGAPKGPDDNKQTIPNLTEKEIFSYDWTSPQKRHNVKQVFNSSYDNATVRVTARRLIEVLRDKDWFSGSFRWTGYDYLGEASYVHGGWPFRAFQGGALDLAGFEKDLFYLYQSQWSDKDMVHILPHWTHPVMAEGELIPVWVYTNGDEVELKVNGKSMGRKRPGTKWDEMQCEWLVPWQEGTVEAISYRNGKEIARSAQKSAGAPTELKLELSDETLAADRQDVTILTITQVDDKGTLYPYGENRVYTKIYGGARVFSFESGSPVDVECNFEAADKECFFGLNRIFLQSTSDKESEPASILTAVISGDKKLMLSDKITIALKEISLRGKLPKRNLTVRYTTDGSEPTKSSKLYNGAFSVELGTVVKAKVYEDGKEIISLEEHFTEEDGLYWGVPGEKPCVFDGEQGEDATFAGGGFKRGGGGDYYGTGYASFREAGSSAAWYQENDGAPMNAQINIRYSQEIPTSKSQMELWNNDKLIKVIDFVNTGSASSHWEEIIVDLPLNSGANNIKLVSKGGLEASPNIDQIKIIQ